LDQSVAVLTFRIPASSGVPWNWVQVIRVQLSNQAASQNAWLRYYAPGSQGVEQLRKKATLSPGTWNGFVVAPAMSARGTW